MKYRKEMLGIFSWIQCHLYSAKSQQLFPQSALYLYFIGYCKVNTPQYQREKLNNQMTPLEQVLGDKGKEKVRDG